MICKKCAKAADKGKKHPKNCACDCQHRNDKKWTQSA